MVEQKTHCLTGRVMDHQEHARAKPNTVDTVEQTTWATQGELTLTRQALGDGLWVTRGALECHWGQ